MTQAFNHQKPVKTGILLTNLGTPSAPDRRSVKAYLKEFLWDPRVVEIPRPLWWLILNGLVLPFRSGQSAKLYQKVWTPDGSPLLVHTKQIGETLQTRVGDNALVNVAMNYGQPAMKDVLQEFRDNQVGKLIVLPLYPQYSATTTGACFDLITKTLQSWRWVPQLHFINQYAGDPKYIQGLVNSIQRHYADKPLPDKLLFSFHGLPQRFFEQGDPYHCYCQKTARLVSEGLQLSKEAWSVSFQSRFGKAKWLEPYTDKTLIEFAKQGLSVGVICPGFAVDCLETLEEINIQNRELFLEHGGKEFDYIPALNASTDHVDCLADLIQPFL